jgi:gamma-glutamyltranspeptidase / glutathione hydrolase
VPTTYQDVRVALAGDEPVQAERGVVSSQHPMAAAVGVELFAAGANVADVAVATAFANTVADVGRTGIGGYGGHLVYHAAAAGQTWLVDFPSRAPLAAHDRMFTPIPDAEAKLDSSGWWPTEGDANQTGALAIGVPAVVAGLAAAHARFGKLAWADVLAPAIRLAEEGIEFGPSGRDPVLDERSRAADFPETQRVFMDAWDGVRLRQTDLARSLRRLAEHGPEDFYSGTLAHQIVAYVKASGGVLDHVDLAQYEATITLANRSRYRDVEVLTSGEKSGGGVLLPLLRELEAFELGAMEPLGGQRMAILARTTGRQWPDRFARDRGTSHFSVADTLGNVVACTTTLQVLLGSAATVPGTGIVLNNAMGLFDPSPGRPNSIAPGKRAITNMCPTIVVRDGRARISIGASGGRRIPSMLVQALTLAIDHGVSLPAALRAPRFHNEGDARLILEEGLSDAALAELRAQGFVIDLKPPDGTALGGQAPAIWFDDAGLLFGVPDPRRHGGAAAI